MTRVLAGLALAVLAASSALAAPPGPAAGPEAQMILHLLDYVAVDYPDAVKDGKVLDRGEYAEQVEFVGKARALLDRLPARAETASLAARADELIALVKGKRAGDEVAALAQRLRAGLIAAYGVEVAPRRPPDVAAAAGLYAVQCAMCHGAEGRGDGPAAKGLDPAPASFHDRDRLGRRSVYGLYSTITLGVAGTAMASYQALPEAERWALAFHVATLSIPPADIARGDELWRTGSGRDLFPDLRSVTTATEREIGDRHGADAVKVLAYLRRRPDAIAAGEDPLARSVRLLLESVVAYRGSRTQVAQDLAVSAYLDGFELVEPALDAVDRKLRTRVEGEMMAYRKLVQSGASAEEVQTRAQAIVSLLEETRQRLGHGGLSPMAGFTGALVILLREGLEAILIVAAIVALLAKAGRRDALPYVHTGWVGALVLGAATWLAASYAITLTGATREVTEGVTALAASAVLLYVGYWMHGNAYALRWRAFVDRHMGAAVSGRTTWALASLSFLAVYREAFETVLLSQALWQQAGASGQPAAVGGFATAAVGLVLAGWLIVRGSLRLPLGVFFGATSALLAVLAVAIAGKGVAALQEAGVVPVSLVNVPAVPLVGLYPSAQGLALQGALIGLIALGFLYTHHAARQGR